MHLARDFSRFISFALLVMALAALSGCVATGTTHAEMKAELDRVPADKARIYFYRTNSVVGMVVQPNISLNGSVVGESKPGGFFYVDVEPGVHEALARTEAISTVSITVRGGETRYVRSSIGLGLFVGRVELTLVDAEQGRIDVATLSFTGATGKPGPSASPAAPSAAGPADAQRQAPSRPVTLDDLDGLLPKK
jgi:hypothetical protein